MSKFIKGQRVNFKRKSILDDIVVTKINLDNIVISAIGFFPQNMPDDLKDTIEQSYVIEYSNGWIPTIKQVKSLELNENKKYIFVKESELTQI